MKMHKGGTKGMMRRRVFEMIWKEILEDVKSIFSQCLATELCFYEVITYKNWIKIRLKTNAK